VKTRIEEDKSTESQIGVVLSVFFISAKHFWFLRLGIFPAFFSEILRSFGVSEFVFSFQKIQGMLSPCFLECWDVAMLVMFAGLPEYEQMGSIYL
jgi:hypothetical protein